MKDQLKWILIQSITKFREYKPKKYILLLYENEYKIHRYYYLLKE